MLLQQPQHGAEKRGLADAVRTQHAHHLAGLQREAHVAPDGAPGEAEGSNWSCYVGHSFSVLLSSERSSAAPGRSARPASRSSRHSPSSRARRRLWSEKARAELARISGRAPAPGTLTPTEERVAALIAAGNTYREVADALFLSPKTVQWNLSKIYRKLGFRSRGELAARLAAEGGSPGDDPAERPTVKVQPFRRFPSSSFRANTGDSADFAAAPAGLPSVR